MIFDLRPNPETKLDLEDISKANKLQVFMVNEELWPTVDSDDRPFSVAGVWEWEYGLHFRLLGFLHRRLRISICATCAFQFPDSLVNKL